MNTTKPAQDPKSHQAFLMILLFTAFGCQPEPGDTFNFEDAAVFGIDISHHQGEIKWDLVKGWEGHKINFVYIKAAEGATYVDDKYQYNLAEASKNGLLVGSYHYFRTTSSPESQFKNFIANVDVQKQDLIPLIDLEEKENWDGKTYHKNLKIFLRLVEDHYGAKPMIYTVNSFYNHTLSGKYSDYKFLIGRYGKNHPNMRDKHNWTIWQFTETGEIEGIPKLVDIDVLNSKADFESLLLNLDR